MTESKDSCLICQIVSNKIPSYKIYEDDMALAVLDVNGANPGHCFVIPKNHYPIIEHVPDLELGNLFSIANKISSSIFENLKAEGTNIFVANGIPAGQTAAHFMINVIPRKENDNINLQWKPKQLSEEEISTVELKLKEQIKNVEMGSVEPTNKPGPLHEKTETSSFADDEDDYIANQLRRIP
ncbi:MAG: HIT domain-containing protein [Candidatus Woesearchaeota archaeon]|jgi:histidine triad (HIT) family protein|nr:HIT family protein [archaeon]MDP6548319.1 HIT domain-containing protein [Candidatus Woesearchaeota archaeon]MDP7263808.1 HIT domain-containing protein [Candidatus Woesearchaeota archaeon]MDP7622865.1 HIT domain-containing protein [Candidatus Woesearchaeota archaeon]HJN56875.1 HIT domain-containing protein [Candidatus Woesearchaeota archaeon]|tara:strand:- start:22415 stop:22963 length:549 start_codon:yes stop_codon:yes gene_type:complete